MNSNPDLITLFSVLAQLSAGLLGFVITLVTLVPTLLQLVQERQTDFLSIELARRDLLKALDPLRWTIWGFGTATLIAILGLLRNETWIAVITLGLFSFSLIVIVRASFAIAKTYKQAISQKK